MLEIFCRRDRRKPIALDGEAENGDPRIVPGHDLLLQAAKAGS